MGCLKGGSDILICFYCLVDIDRCHMTPTFSLTVTLELYYVSVFVVVTTNGFKPNVGTRHYNIHVSLVTHGTVIMVQGYMVNVIACVMRLGSRQYFVQHVHICKTPYCYRSQGVPVEVQLPDQEVIVQNPNFCQSSQASKYVFLANDCVNGRSSTYHLADTAQVELSSQVCESLQFQDQDSHCPESPPSSGGPGQGHSHHPECQESLDDRLKGPSLQQIYHISCFYSLWCLNVLMEATKQCYLDTREELHHLLPLQKDDHHHHLLLQKDDCHHLLHGEVHDHLHHDHHLHQMCLQGPPANPLQFYHLHLQVDLYPGHNQDHDAGNIIKLFMRHSILHVKPTLSEVPATQHKPAADSQSRQDVIRHCCVNFIINMLCEVSRLALIFVFCIWILILIIFNCCRTVPLYFI